MQGNRIRWVVIGGFFTFASAITMPALAMMSVPCGWYLEANVGSGHLSGKSYPGKSSSSGLAGNVDVGYKFMPYFAIEGGYSQFPETQIKNQVGDKVAKDNHYVYGLWGKGIVPIIDSGFELFAKLGIERNVSNVKIQDADAANVLGIGRGQHSTTGLYMGVGGEYYFMPEMAVNVQWQRAKGNSSTGTLDLYSIGLSFVFD